jgi:hypothetical protein
MSDEADMMAVCANCGYPKSAHWPDGKPMTSALPPGCPGFVPDFTNSEVAASADKPAAGEGSQSESQHRSDSHKAVISPAAVSPAGLEAAEAAHAANIRRALDFARTEVYASGRGSDELIYRADEGLGSLLAAVRSAEERADRKQESNLVLIEDAKRWQRAYEKARNELAAERDEAVRLREALQAIEDEAEPNDRKPALVRVELIGRIARAALVPVAAPPNAALKSESDARVGGNPDASEKSAGLHQPHPVQEKARDGRDSQGLAAPPEEPSE